MTTPHDDKAREAAEPLKTWPERIYLQHSEDGYPIPEFGVGTDEVTWCRHKQFDCDIEYVRADIARSALSAEAAKQEAECIGYADALAIKNFDKGLSDELSVVRQPNGFDEPAPVYLAAPEQPSDTLRRVGAQMASVMFNLAQQAGKTLDSDDCALFDKLRNEWDAARVSSPALDAARVRDAALEEAAMICQDWHSSQNAQTAVAIRALKSSPPEAQQDGDCARLLAALKPFAESYKPEAERLEEFGATAELREFLDRNRITPPMTMGDFRKAYEAVFGSAAGKEGDSHD